PTASLPVPNKIPVKHRHFCPPDPGKQSARSSRSRPYHERSKSARESTTRTGRPASFLLRQLHLKSNWLFVTEPADLALPPWRKSHLVSTCVSKDGATRRNIDSPSGECIRCHRGGAAPDRRDR